LIDSGGDCALVVTNDSSDDVSVAAGMKGRRNLRGGWKSGNLRNDSIRNLIHERIMTWKIVNPCILTPCTAAQAQEVVFNNSSYPEIG
jgi:hypothetical protein